jgi:hypothetical protein
MNPKPELNADFASLPSDLKERHEALVDFFGEHLFWCRAQALDTARRAVASPELREQLGRIPAEPFDRVSTLPESARIAALDLAQASVDQFMRLLLVLLTGTGTDQRLGSDHAIRYKLLMEVVAVHNPDCVAHEEIINRTGRKAFFDYFGRWLNRFHADTNLA